MAKSEFEKQKEMARLKRLRHESFLLNPPSRTGPKNLVYDEGDELMKELVDIDEKNNNYMRNSINLNTEQQVSNNDLAKEKRSNTLMSQDRPRTISDIKRDFQLGDIIDFVHKGMEVMIQIYKLNFEFIILKTTKQIFLDNY